MNYYSPDKAYKIYNYIIKPIQKHQKSQFEKLIFRAISINILI